MKGVVTFEQSEAADLLVMLDMLISKAEEQFKTAIGSDRQKLSELILRFTAVRDKIASAFLSEQDFGLEILTNSIGMEFVKIPAGTFWMGSGDDDERAHEIEKPRHKVEISRSFYLGRYPVTQAEWETVMGRGVFGQSNRSHFKSPDRPVENVSWNDTQEFIRKLNKREGHNCYRLPTEAEWEYACRAGSTTAYSFGDDADQLDAYAWYNENSGSKTHPVGQKKSNAWNLYDMHGNVWEWVQDWYGDYSDGFVRDPQGPRAGEYRVRRGGNWGYPAMFCRSAVRARSTPDAYRFVEDVGFRLVLSPEN